jgi:hypothetical protein
MVGAVGTGVIVCAILAYALLRSNGASDLSWFARSFDVRHPQLIDPSFAVVNRYGITGYPGLYIVDRRGVITYAWSGHVGYAKLAKQLSAVLKST